jgi:hypothetical protein
MPYWERAVAIVAAVMLVVPDITADLIGLALSAGLLLLHFMRRPAIQPASVGAASADRPREHRL